jgi:hypothetical protein
MPCFARNSVPKPFWVKADALLCPKFSSRTILGKSNWPALPQKEDSYVLRIFLNGMY